ncbi:PTS transporter subunit EIIC [Williamsoniiplasma luminosum]|uniref:PTS transporter subunit EIIC n=1 Tax=Williamsoniiplasma luminosum TaxID=214888 RepID=UPI00350E455F
MAVLSTLSRAFLLPIALLPIAGVFLGIGALIASKTTELSIGWYIGSTIKAMGDVAFGNLPILFAMSVALAYSKESGIAALTAVVGFLVMNAMQGALLHPVLKTGSDKDIAYYTLLFYNGSSDILRIPEKLIASNLGVTSLNTGVFAGIFVGAISAYAYNKFRTKKLPAGIDFFGGTRLVPIVTFFMVIPLSFIFMITWPIIGIGLSKFGNWTGTLPTGVDSLVFEIVERSLVPFGLHHVFYAPLWWTQAGGSISEALINAGNKWDVSRDAILNTSWLPVAFSGTNMNFKQWIESYLQLSNHANVTADMTPSVAMADILNHFKIQGLAGTKLFDANGDQYMMQAVIGGSSMMNFTLLENLGLNLGRFQSGKFGFMLLGLPMAGLAMWLTVPKENRKSVMGIYFSAAFTCFLTGITEPLEYSFLFLAPWLFYGVHMPLAATSFFLAGALQTHVSMTVSGGIIDYIVFGIIPFVSGLMKWQSAFGILIVAAAMAPLYFFAFYFAVKAGKVEVPGREGAKLFTKADFKNKKAEKAEKAEQAEQVEQVEQNVQEQPKAIVEIKTVKVEQPKINANDLTKELVKKYDAKLSMQRPLDEEAHAKLNVKERAKIDGSANITEPRSELQKYASALREQAEQQGIKLRDVNLRDMTKKELILYMKHTALKINS